MSSPRVSVVVPVYNGAATIEACVDSIFALSFPQTSVELILIDNASSDDTPSILARYGDRATVLHEARRGPAAARNCGLRSATGEIVAFTDADCVVHPEWLTRIIEPLGDTTIGIAGGRILSKRPCNAIEEFGERIHDHRLAIECDSPPYAITMNWASPKRVLDAVGGFDETMMRCEDCDLAYRIIAGGHRIVYEPGAVVYHRNERSFPGLMTEGYAHGYHSIPLLKKHEDFVRRYALESPSAPRPPSPPGDELYWRIFNFGKAAGKSLATLRSRVTAV